MKLNKEEQKRKNRLVQTKWAKEFRKQYKTYWYKECINYIAQNKRFTQDELGGFIMIDHEELSYIYSYFDLEEYKKEDLIKLGLNIVHSNRIIRTLQYIWKQIKP